MDKVRLSLDKLQVQSFATTSGQAEQRGTVHGNDQCSCQCCPTDPALNTCWDSCADTCWNSCGGTCDCDGGSGYCGGGSGSCGCGSEGCGSESFLATNCYSYGYGYGC